MATRRAVMPRLETILAAADNYGATSPRAIATSGARIVMIGYRKLYASNKGASFRLLGPKRPPVKFAAHDTGLLQFDADLAIDDDELWVCGYRGVARSIDGGATFRVVPTPKGSGVGGLPALTVIARSHDRTVWVGGDHGTLFVYRGGAKFQRVRGTGASAVHALVPSPLGVLVTTDGGQLFVADSSKATTVRKLGLQAAGPLYDACVTPARSIIAVGASGAYRASEGGGSFVRSKVPLRTDLYAIVVLPDGRLLVGADEGQLLVSFDDGVSFERLRGGKRASAPKRGAYAFDLACPYREGALIGGTCQGLIYAI